MADAHSLADDLTALAARVIAENKAAGRMVAVAESCTGGLVCAALTEIPGSSAVLDRGFVTYSNEAKMEMLGVQSDIIDAFGAVSPATAWAMAQGAIEHSRADIAVAISGVAGPDGGTEMKPVGTVVFACAMRGEENVNAEQKLLDGQTRGEIRHQAALIALELLLP
ncbi:CinA-like protein [Novosphingobium sp. Rr 2-17]|uniref:CinA family protein n=1 Tax=Novosphingobium sp. Rr 2-17 TaxID=555793 RepID=UPI000269A4B7|nr:CinA family protein [Novosphingobium sp. Rr 2-17]EIZ80332.1 CinA-like protein [Novosphingobium sp. Rr 2-17]